MTTECLKPEARSHMQNLHTQLTAAADALQCLLSGEKIEASRALLMDHTNLLDEWRIKSRDLKFYLTCIKAGRCTQCQSDPCTCNEGDEREEDDFWSPSATWNEENPREDEPNPYAGTYAED